MFTQSTCGELVQGQGGGEESFALDRVAEALAELEERRQVGKAIVAMDMSASQEVEVTGSRGNVTKVPKESRRE